MADDERTTRRVSDATRARIDELAAGWKVEAPLQANSAPSAEALAVATPISGSRDAKPGRAATEQPAETTVQDHGEWLPQDPAPYARGTAAHPNAEPPIQDSEGQPRTDQATLRRKPGIVGDVSYVVTTLVGIRTAKKELKALELRQDLRQTSREHHFVTLGRSALASDGYDDAAIRSARDAMQAVELDRSKCVAAVSASQAELERIRRNREASAKAYGENLAASEAEIAALTKKLAPLVAEIAAARRRAADVDEQVRRITKRIAATEAKLSAEKTKQLDPIVIQAEIAALRADQQAVQRDQPKNTAAIDTLSPQIASLRAEMRTVELRRRELIARDVEEHVRTAELLEAAGAGRKVEERNALAAGVARDKILRELGGHLHGERPAVLSAQAAPIDQINSEVDAGNRRIAELHETIASVDRHKFIRGAVMIASLALVTAAGFWLAL